jgi:uncharacterized membrane protein YbhN (UPF0104 family)
VSQRVVRVIEGLLVAAGITLFVVLLMRLGVTTVLANVRAVGWGMALIIGAEILAYVANALGWRAVFHPGGSIPSFGRLLAARIAGDAANYLTPTATLGGEFIRARMLEGHVTVTSAIAAVAVAKLTQTIGLLAFLVVGFSLVLDAIRLPPGARWALLAALSGFATVLFALAVLQRRGLFGPALRLVERWPRLGSLGPLRSSLEQLDAEIARIHAESAGRVVLSVMSFALGFSVGILESYLVLTFLGVPVTFRLALAVEVLGVGLNNVLFFVPLRAGTQEAGKSLVFALLGLDAAQGLAAGVLYRIRELTWALIGMVIYLLYRRAQAGLHPVRRAPRGGL